MKGSGAYAPVKRLLDLCLAALGLAALCVPMALIALAVALDTPGGAIFTQVRVGRAGVCFRMYKFRTMSAGRVTRSGRLLRTLSLDELPQLLNVLRGEMSLVGPRPLVPEEDEMHRQRARLGVYELRPGLTGLAQIHGRDLLNDGEKLRWDAQYRRDLSFRQDVRILFATVPRVLRGEGVKDREEDGNGG